MIGLPRTASKSTVFILILSKCSVLVSVPANSEPTPGTLGVRQECRLNVLTPRHCKALCTHTHTHTPGAIYHSYDFAKREETSGPGGTLYTSCNSKIFRSLVEPCTMARTAVAKEINEETSLGLI